MNRMEWTNCLVLLCCLCLGVPTLGKTMPGTTEMNDSGDMLRRGKRSYENPTIAKWKVYRENKKYIIPYEIVDLTGEDHSQQLLEAFEDYHNFTCIRFRPRTDEEEYITITIMNGKIANENNFFICGITNPEEKTVLINVDCGQLIFTIRHELYHVIGFRHEFQRPDGGEYINFVDEMFPNTDERIKSVDLTPFDIYSISLYDELRSKETNTILGKGYGRLSYFDIKNINKVYRCADTLLYNGCSGANLPTVIGAGHLSSNRSIYEEREGVRILCDEGYETVETQFSYCENGTFFPVQLECRKMTCEDDEFTECGNLVQNGICYSADLNEKKLCQRSCGFCESVCYRTPPIKMLGYISFPSNLKPFYLQNETLTFKCPYGYLPLTKDHATCMGESGWDVKEFQCIKSISAETGNYDDWHTVDVNKCKIEELPNIAHGKYVPHKESYDREDVVQLVCDHGFQPVSSSTAYCKRVSFVNWVPTNKFDFTHLECIEKTCVNAPYMDLMCGLRKAVGQCNQTENIGYMRKYCKRTCQLCDTCKSTPIFDRHVSYVTPMKTEYQSGESVEITCINGYHPVNTATAECRESGQFNPPQLVCEPDTTSCTDGLPSITGARSVFPVLQSYPSGYEITVVCMSTNPIDPFNHIGSHDDVIDRVRCLDGKFEYFTCPPEKLCTSSQLDVFAIEACNVTSHIPMEYIPTFMKSDEPLEYEPRKTVYGEDDKFVKVFCSPEDVKLVACADGKWFTNMFFYPHDVHIGEDRDLIARRILSEESIDYIDDYDDYDDEYNNRTEEDTSLYDDIVSNNKDDTHY